ncbi:MAG: rhomboid family intramembrane serine protease [Alicyclobacillaceae bacterium]|nr:rhomboid family intramembrane serine protease [Alicyclobacillaceae bacterium]
MPRGQVWSNRRHKSQAMRTRIEDGTRRLLARLSVFSVNSWKNSPSTTVIVLLCIMWFVGVEPWHGYSASGLLTAGALSGQSLQSGRPYELVSAIFVHVTIVHIVVNLVSLWSLRVVEMLLRWRFFIPLFFFSGVLGNLLTVWVLPPYVVSAGASGAIFGVFGAALVLAFQGIFTRGTRNWLLVLLVVNLVFDFSAPGIDWIAHIGGLCAGILITFLYKWSRGRSQWWTSFSGLSGILTALACVAVFLHF